MFFSSFRRWQRRAAAALGVATLFLLTGCGASGSAGSGESADGLLVARDGALRALDSECSGSGALIFMHVGATLTAVADDGEIVIEQQLPAGVPLRTDEKDYGKSPRVPTLCTFTFDATALADGVSYSFYVDDRSIGEHVFRRADDGVGAISFPALGDPAAVFGVDSEVDE